MQPLVSVIVLTYNHDLFIKKCIEGIIRQQTDFEFEVLIADDVSTDNTKEICLALCRNDNRLHFHQNIRNDGPAMNFKKTIARSKGKFIAMCDGDDYWCHVQKLQMQVNALMEDSGCALVYANYGKVDAQGDITVDKVLRDDHEAINLKQIVSKSGPSTNSFMYRRRIIPKKFPKAFFTVINPDVFILAWALKAGSSRYIPEVLSMYRVHRGGVYSSKSTLEKNLIFFSTRMAVFKTFGWDYVAEMEQCKEHFKTVLARCKKTGHPALYSEFLKKLPLDDRLVFKALGWYYHTMIDRGTSAPHETDL